MTGDARRLRLAVAGSLPPDENGPAFYLAGMLDELGRHADLTLLVEHPTSVAPAIRERFDVRPLVERYDDSHDLVLYHVANNPWHAAVVDAAREGPPGLLVVHDVSLHHLEFSRTVGQGRLDAYRDLLQLGHGELGEQFFDRFLQGPPEGLALDRFLFDLYGELLDRHLAAQVHSAWAQQLLTLRRPGFPIHQVPLFAPPPAPPLDVHARFGIPAGRVVVCHAGFVSPPKQFPVLVAAFAEVVRAGHDAHLLFLGEDQSRGELDELVEEHGLVDRVTVSGWTSDEEFQRSVASVDVAVSLRWPHVGESSATLAASLSAGRAVVLEPLGAWAEVPADVVLRCDLSTRPVRALADGLTRVVADPALRRRLGARAEAYAREHLSVERCAEEVVALARRTAEGSRQLPAVTVRRRAEAVRVFLQDGAGRPEAVPPAGERDPDEPALVLQPLASLPPAHLGARLLDLGGGPALLQLLSAVWGYDVHGTVPGLDLQRDRLPHETGSVDVVTCWGVLEDLDRDPMHLLSEVNRVLVPGGVLHLSTGTDDRRGRQYAPGDLRVLLAAAGLSPDGVGARALARQASSDDLEQAGLEGEDALVVVARKAGPVLERHPRAFYTAAGRLARTGRAIRTD